MERTKPKMCALCGHAAHPKQLSRMGNKVLLKAMVLDVLGEDISQVGDWLLHICRSCNTKVERFYEFKKFAKPILSKRLKFEKEAYDALAKEHEKKTPEKIHVETDTVTDPVSDKRSLVNSVESALDKDNSDSQKSVKPEPKNEEQEIKISKVFYSAPTEQGLVIQEAQNSDINSKQKAEQENEIKPENKKSKPEKDTPPLSAKEQVAFEHGYGKIPVNQIKEKHKEVVLESPLLPEEEMDMVKLTDFRRIFEELKNEDEVHATRIAFLLSKSPALDIAVKQLILKDIEAALRSKFKKDSMLYSRETQKLGPKRMFETIFLELQEKVPFLANILLLCCQESKIKSTVSMVATIFGMMMHSRSRQLSAVQRFYSSLCVKYHSDLNEILSLLNVIHLTLDYNSKRIARDSTDPSNVKKRKPAQFASNSTKNTIVLPKNSVAEVPSDEEMELTDICMQ